MRLLPRPNARSWRPTLPGVVLGIALVVAGRYLIVHTTLVDHLVAPLSHTDTGGSADVIVVPGAGLTQFCTPNLHGIQRVLLAADLYHRGRAPLILFSGGRTNNETQCDVAGAMTNLAVRLGVPRERIRTETTSLSTWQNALRSDAWLRVIGAQRILLVSDRPHLRRLEAVFGRFGYTIERAGVPIPLGHVNNVDVLTMGLREYAAWGLYWMRGYVDRRPADAALVAPVGPPSHSGLSHGGQRMEGHADRPGANRVVVIGASYANGWQIPQIDKITFENKGVAGQESWQLLERFDRDVVAAGPRAVIIWGFINDIFRSPRPDIERSLARARESFVTMIERAQAAGIEPILATEVTTRRRAGVVETVMSWIGNVLGRQSYHDYVNKHVLDTNVWLNEVARQRGLLLLDLQRVVSEPGGMRRRAFAAADGSHITAAGYEALTRVSVPLLKVHFGAPD